MSKHISENIMEMCKPFVFDKSYDSKPYQFRLTHDISVDNFDFINNDYYEFEKDFSINRENDNDSGRESPCNECGNTSTGSGLYDTYDVCTCDSRAASDSSTAKERKTPKRDDSVGSLRGTRKSSLQSLCGSVHHDEADDVSSDYSSPFHNKRCHSPSDTPYRTEGRLRRRSGDPTAPSSRAASPMSMSSCSEKSLADEIFEAECIAALEKQQHEGLVDPSGFRPPEALIRRLSQSLHVDFSLSFNPFLDGVGVDKSPDDDETPRSHFPPTRFGGGFMSEYRKVSLSSTSTTLSSASAPACPGSGAAGGIDDLEATHRGIHRFIPRHHDEMAIEIGDMVHVAEECDDLWCSGVNLRTGKRGIFPAVYAQDLDFLEDDEGRGERKPDKFTLKFMGSVEVANHKGIEVVCNAINKVLFSRRTMPASKPQLCTLEINEYGIRMMDKFKGRQTGGNSINHNHFFLLKNVSFCGHHPQNEKYFGFITKHPSERRFAAHIFLGETSTKHVAESIGKAFRRLHQEYMAFAHPTEDIYIE